MFGREAAPPPPVVLSVVDEINYGWTQHFTKSVAYTLPIGKKTTFEFAVKNDFDYFEFYPLTEAKHCCSTCSWPCIVQSFLIDPHFYTPQYSLPARKSAGQSKMNHR